MFSSTQLCRTSVPGRSHLRATICPGGKFSAGENNTERALGLMNLVDSPGCLHEDQSLLKRGTQCGACGAFEPCSDAGIHRTGRFLPAQGLRGHPSLPGPAAGRGAHPASWAAEGGQLSKSGAPGTLSEPQCFSCQTREIIIILFSEAAGRVTGDCWPPPRWQTGRHVPAPPDCPENENGVAVQHGTGFSKV